MPRPQSRRLRGPRIQHLCGMYLGGFAPLYKWAEQNTLSQGDRLRHALRTKGRDSLSRADPIPCHAPVRGQLNPQCPSSCSPRGFSFFICLGRVQLVPTLFGSVDTPGLWKMTSLIPTARARKGKTREVMVAPQQRAISLCTGTGGGSRGSSRL